jgi:hypothetical protein
MHRRTRLRSTAPLALLALLALLGPTACSPGQPDVSIRVVSETAGPLFYCRDATVSLLGPGDSGGYRFDCAGEGTLYLEYDTDSPGDGTIERIIMNPDRDVFVASEHETNVRDRGLPACPAAQAAGRTSGEVPLPMQRGRLATGDHTILLSYPCGPATITIGAPAEP